MEQNRVLHTRSQQTKFTREAFYVKLDSINFFFFIYHKTGLIGSNRQTKCCMYAVDKHAIVSECCGCE